MTWLADCQDTWTLPLVLWLISKHGEMVHVWISFWGILYLKWHLWTWVFKFAFMHLLLLLSDWFESANHFALVLSWSFQGLWWKSEVTSKIDIGNKGQSVVYSNVCLCVKVFLIGIYLKSNHLTMITSKNCIRVSDFTFITRASQWLAFIKWKVFVNGVAGPNLNYLIMKLQLKARSVSGFKWYLPCSDLWSEARSGIEILWM